MSDLETSAPPTTAMDVVKIFYRLADKYDNSKKERRRHLYDALRNALRRECSHDPHYVPITGGGGRMFLPGAPVLGTFEQLTGEGESGRGVRSPARSNYSSPTPGLAHAS